MIFELESDLIADLVQWTSMKQTTPDWLRATPSMIRRSRPPLCTAGRWEDAVSEPLTVRFQQFAAARRNSPRPLVTHSRTESQPREAVARYRRALASRRVQPIQFERLAEDTFASLQGHMPVVIYRELSLVNIATVLQPAAP